MVGEGTPTGMNGAHAPLFCALQYLPQIALPSQTPAAPIAIAEMAELFGVTHRTLHFYEQKGLLTCGRDGARRVYSDGDVARMALISLCRDVGMPVAAIQDLFDELLSAGSYAQANAIFQLALRRHLDGLVVSLTTLQRQAEQIESLLDLDIPPAPQAPPPAIDLSRQERHCLELMAEGYTTVRLAHVLELTKPDVETLERTLIRKFKAHNRFQAVAKAVLLGYVSTHEGGTDGRAQDAARRRQIWNS
ncbi:MerR family transcriptional regulator [Rhizobium halophytocola]|uniref:DNA-binding transcriptional MerR regulator n=1 Tax=Rhizobium halophytocola TaxID=735519 RepID=A0ABS4E6A7_9HYPH|nr:MerR family transcriptional regulator [Rhizobium halophytocola]MBP1853482.1 DNA-binding transcriptional MerR regulator [Rhizobium halophytocola]